MGKVTEPVRFPVGSYLTASGLESMGWNRTQIGAILGKADHRVHMGSGITVSLFDHERVREALPEDGTTPSARALERALEQIFQTLDSLCHADIEVSDDVNDALPDKIHHHLRKRYSDYRNLDDEGKDRSVLSHIRHRYTSYDEQWQAHYVRLPLAGLLHDAYRIRAHELIARQCPDFATRVAKINARMHNRLNEVICEVKGNLDI